MEQAKSEWNSVLQAALRDNDWSSVSGAGSKEWEELVMAELTSNNHLELLATHRRKVLEDPMLFEEGLEKSYRRVTNYVLRQHARPSTLLQS